MKNLFQGFMNTDSQPNGKQQAVQPAVQEGTMIAPQSFESFPTHLAITGSPSFDDWLSYGTYLSRTNRWVHFYIGDWLIYGEGRWGEKYKEAERITGFDAHTLANDKMIAIAIPPEKRRKELSFSHYELLTRFDEEEQEEYIEAAIQNKFSVKAFTDYIKHKEDPFKSSTNQVSPHGDNSTPHPSASPETVRTAENNQLTMEKALRLSEELFAMLDEIDYDGVPGETRIRFIKKLRETSRRIDGLWWTYKEDDDE